MGLDATVFKSLSNVMKEQVEPAVSFKVDVETGEVIPYDGAGNEVAGKYDLFCALQIRIGNISEVAFLRTKTQAHFGAGRSLIERLILYHGAHSGDLIRPEHFGLLVRELDLLRDLEPKASRFTNDFKALIRAAEAERNPIVFT